MLAFFLAAGAVYAAAAVAYFRGRFGPAAILGLLFYSLTAPVVLHGMGRAGAAVTLLFLCVVPGLYLVLHYVDAKRGLFYLPTIYSIPIAFLCGLLLWLLAGIVM